MTLLVDGRLGFELREKRDLRRIRYDSVISICAALEVALLRHNTYAVVVRFAETSSHHAFLGAE